LGGEKLKIHQSHFAAILAASFVIASSFGIASPLLAQTVEPVYGADIAVSEAAEYAFVEPAAVFDETTFRFDTTFPAAQAPIGGATTFVAIRMVLVLAVAALAIYGVVFFVKRFARPQESRDPHLKLLAQVPLSSDSYAAVISVGGKAWLVGGGSGGLNLISEINDTETLETLLLDDARRNAASDFKGFDFQSLLRRFRGNAAARTGMPAGSFSDRLRKQRERVRGL